MFFPYRRRQGLVVMKVKVTLEIRLVAHSQINHKSALANQQILPLLRVETNRKPLAVLRRVNIACDKLKVETMSEKWRQFSTYRCCFAHIGTCVFLKTEISRRSRISSLNARDVRSHVNDLLQSGVSIIQGATPPMTLSTPYPFFTHAGIAFQIAPGFGVCLYT